MDTKNITIRIRGIRQADEITLTEILDLLPVDYAIVSSAASERVDA